MAPSTTTLLGQKFFAGTGMQNMAIAEFKTKCKVRADDTGRYLAYSVDTPLVIKLTSCKTAGKQLMRPKAWGKQTRQRVRHTGSIRHGGRGQGGHLCPLLAHLRR